MKISLTFDNGPEPGVTSGVLDTLAHHDIAASFFVLGRQLFGRAAQDTLRRAWREGHRIGNHTFTHSIAFGELEDPSEGIREIEQTAEKIGDFADPARLFRPTGNGGQLGKHVLSRAIYDYLCRERYTCVLWNSVPRDWLDADGWVDTALRQIQEQPWSVTVLHDIYPQAMKHLDRFICAAKDLGAEFTTGYPDDCVPLLQGAERWDPSALITEHGAADAAAQT